MGGNAPRDERRGARLFPRVRASDRNEKRQSTRRMLGCMSVRAAGQGQRQLDTRRVNPEIRERHLDWEHCYNARDLGGLPTRDGGETRWRAIVRSDLPARLNERGQEALLAYGIRTLLDLRAPHELAKQPSPFSKQIHGERAPAYVNVSLDKFDPDVRVLLNQATSVAEIYNIILDHYADMTAAAMRALANAGPGGILVHCHSGKDRTGTISALVLYLANVPMEHIARDYALTQARLWSLYEKTIAEMDGEPENHRWLKPLTPPKTIYAMFEHLETKYGSVREYLRYAGMTDEEMERIAERLR